MRNSYDASPEVVPAAMPIVALVLSVVGLCLPPFLLVGVILGLISLIRSGEPAYATRRVPAIVSLVMLLLAVPVWGILAAIAIPNFIRFQARSKQSECKTNLKAAYVAERAYFAEHDHYSVDPREVGFSPERKNRYLYRFDSHGPVSRVGVEPDPSVQPMSASALDEGVTPELRDLPGLRGHCPDCSLTVVCVGNIDNDEGLDVWSISTAERATVSGERVPAGQPTVHFNDVNDLTETELQDQGATEAADLKPRAEPKSGGASNGKPAPVAEDGPGGDDAWTSYSNDGNTTLRQTSVNGQCSTECRLATGEVAWAKDGICIAKKGERRFVSPDCQRVVVLIPAPNRGRDWAQTKVMRVYSKGKLDYEVSGAAMLAEKYMRSSTSWLQGCYGAPGTEPQYSDDGLSVEYTMIDGHAGKVSLVAEAAPAEDDPPPATRPKRKHH